MPGVTGLDVLRSIRDVSPKCKVVLMTGYATIDSAVEAVKLGALDYLTKPFDLQRLRLWTLFTRDAHGLYRQYGFGEPRHAERLMEKRQAQPHGPAGAITAAQERSGP